MNPRKPLDPEVDGRFQFRLLLFRWWAYKWSLLLLISVLMGVAWFVLEQLTPRYVATTLVLLKEFEKNVSNAENILDRVDDDSRYINNQIELIRSRTLIAATLEIFPQENQVLGTQPPTTRFWNTREFPWLEELKDGAKGFWEIVKAYVGKEKSSKLNFPSDSFGVRENLIDRFLERLSVENIVDTQLVSITFSHEDPNVAANLANALAEVYIEYNYKKKEDAIRDAVDLLRLQLDEISHKVDQSERALERFWLAKDSAKQASASIEMVRSNLDEAQRELDEISLRYTLIEELKSKPEWLDKSGILESTPLLSVSRAELFKLQQELADIAPTYGEKHPKMVNLRASIEGVKATIRKELDNVIETISNQLIVKRKRLDQLKQDLTELRNERNKFSDSEIEFRILENNSETLKRSYDGLFNRYQEALLQQKIQSAGVSIFARATVPNFPSYPPRIRVLFGTFAFSIVFGLALIECIEFFRRGFMAAGELEEQTGVSVITTIPYINARRFKSPADIVVEKQQSIYAHSITKFVSYVDHLLGDRNNIAFSIGSALPGEGKTLTAVAIGRRAALTGDKCLLIDCDFYRPQAHKHLGLKLSPGLTEVMTRSVPVKECLQRDECSNLHFLSSGLKSSDPVSMIKSDKFKELLNEFRTLYRIIIIDTTPFLAVSESEIVFRAVDETFLVVRWSSTPRQSLLVTVKKLQKLGVNVGGLILNKINIKKQGRYGYSEFAYYASMSKDYYSN